jgi:hypothetical protein
MPVPAKSTPAEIWALDQPIVGDGIAGEVEEAFLGDKDHCLAVGIVQGEVAGSGTVTFGVDGQSAIERLDEDLPVERGRALDQERGCERGGRRVATGDGDARIARTGPERCSDRLQRHGRSSY